MVFSCHDMIRLCCSYNYHRYYWQWGNLLKYQQLHLHLKILQSSFIQVQTHVDSFINVQTISSIIVEYFHLKHKQHQVISLNKTSLNMWETLANNILCFIEYWNESLQMSLLSKVKLWDDLRWIYGEFMTRLNKVIEYDYHDHVWHKPCFSRCIADFRDHTLCPLRPRTFEKKKKKICIIRSCTWNSFPCTMCFPHIITYKYTKAQPWNCPNTALHPECSQSNDIYKSKRTKN